MTQIDSAALPWRILKIATKLGASKSCLRLLRLSVQMSPDREVPLDDLPPMLTSLMLEKDPSNKNFWSSNLPLLAKANSVTLERAKKGLIAPTEDAALEDLVRQVDLLLCGS